MGKIKISAFFFLLFSFSSYLVAQQSKFQTSADSSQYYLRHWSLALDSLKKDWIATKVNHGVEETHKKNYSQETSSTHTDAYEKGLQQLGIIYGPRATEIYNLYYQNFQQGRIAFALLERYHEVFLQMMDSLDLPPEFAYLPFALSAMNNHSRSYIGGAGYWQIPYTYGKKYGLQVNSYVDERLEVNKATTAAAKTLKALYQIYGDWKLTLAAYSCGPSNVNKAIRRNGNQVDFYAIRASLPYFGRDVVDALAATTAFFEKTNISSELKYNIVLDTIRVSKRLHFQQIADIMNYNIEEIRFLNPIYKYDIVPAINKVYTLYLPQGSLLVFNSLEDSIYSYKDSLLFNLHERVILPPPPKGRHWATPAKEEVPENSVAVYYNIKSGDNLGYVASWFNVSVSQIEDWNNIYNPRRIQIGKKLKIYVPKSKAAHYRKINSMSFSQRQKLVGKPVSSSKSNTTSPKKPSQELTSGYFWHTVKSGESPYIIAKKFPGVSADDILRWNNITDATKIQVGQKLKIKKNK